MEVSKFCSSQGVVFLLGRDILPSRVPLTSHYRTAFPGSGVGSTLLTTEIYWALLLWKKEVGRGCEWPVDSEETKA